MSNPNAAKGARFELDIVRYLQAWFGRAAYRPHAEGFEDVGDIHLSPAVLQAKNYASVADALNVGLKGAEEQAARAGEPFGLVVIKKRGANVAQARVALTLRAFRRLVARLRRAEELLLRADPELFDHHMTQTKQEENDQ